MDERSIDEAVQEIIADGKLTSEEKQRLSALILADGQLSVAERRVIDELLTLIGKGEVVVVD